MILPFNTYAGYQDAMLLRIEKNIGRRTMLVEESRGVGMSWMLLLAIAHRFQFGPSPTSFLLLSRNEDMVDKKGDPDCLFWKLEQIFEWQPEWLLPRIEQVHLLFRNMDTNATISGESTTGKGGRGGRKTLVAPDEFAHVEAPKDTELVSSIAFVADSVIYSSTPNGASNEFYRKRNQPGMEVVTLHWSLNPEYSAGLYTSVDGKLKILDTEYKYPLGYPFIIDGEYPLRSPWFDAKCQDLGSRRLILQELEITYHGSGSEAFDADVLTRMEREARPPLLRGRLTYEPISCRPTGFVENPTGELQLWVSVDAHGMAMTNSDCVIGCDISRGTGATKSCASVVNRATGEKIGSYKTAHRAPHEFAEDVVALCRMFPGAQKTGAYLIWEANGPGQNFGDSVGKLHYGRVYFHRQEDQINKKSTKKPGFWSVAKTKNFILDNLNRAYSRGTFLNRCLEDISEARQYKVQPGNILEHIRASLAEDPANARENHGDAVIADALANHLLEITAQKPKEEKPEIFEGSYAWRRQQRRLTWMREESW